MSSELFRNLGIEDPAHLGFERRHGGGLAALAGNIRNVATNRVYVGYALTFAFGFGAHYCLGTHLARLEARAFYDELIPRLDHAELAGEPTFMKTIFVGGPKRVPVRYKLR